jgi:hypothetical protein
MPAYGGTQNNLKSKYVFKGKLSVCETGARLDKYLK